MYNRPTCEVMLRSSSGRPDLWSSGDTIPNCVGEFREIRESKQRTGIAPYGHPAGAPPCSLARRLIGAGQEVDRPANARQKVADGRVMAAVVPVDRRTSCRVPER